MHFNVWIVDISSSNILPAKHTQCIALHFSASHTHRSQFVTASGIVVSKLANPYTVICNRAYLMETSEFIIMIDRLLND